MAYRACLLVLIAIATTVSACGGAPASSRPARELSVFQPHLLASLTPTIAIEKFGPPDSEMRSDKRVLVYRLTNNRRLLLSFPGEAPIIFARVEDAGGLTTELPLRQQ
jgi:hypothetical protein